MRNSQKSSKVPEIKFTQGEAIQEIKKLDEETCKNINELLSITNEIKWSSLVGRWLSISEKFKLNQINWERMTQWENIFNNMEKEVKDIVVALVYWKSIEEKSKSMRDEYNEEIAKVMGWDLVDDSETIYQDNSWEV